MSKLEELIKELCPNGVEYNYLGCYCSFFNGDRGKNYPSSKDYVEKGIPFINAGNIADGLVDLKVCNKISQEKYESMGGAKLRLGDIVYCLRGSIGKNGIFRGDSGTLASSLVAIRPSSSVCGKYIYYLLNSNMELGQRMRQENGAAQPNLSAKSVREYVFPFPPLPIQEEIVRILDTFTELEAELKAELKARKKQYEFYRDKLLTFGDFIQRFPICEVCVVSSGSFVKSDKQRPDAPYPVFNGGTTNTGLYDEYNFSKNKVIMSSRGANAGFVNRVFEHFWAGNSCYVFDADNFKLNWNYLYYILKKEQNSFISSQQTGSIPAVSKKQVENYIIPVPPLEEQERIVSILDRFDTLCNDISQGLPKEIELRHKQYEYYRDKLLTFPRKEA